MMGRVSWNCEFFKKKHSGMEAFGTCQDYINMIQFLKQLHDTVTMFSWHNFFKCSPLVVSSDRCDCLKAVIIFDREVLPLGAYFLCF